MGTFKYNWIQSLSPLQSTYPEVVLMIYLQFRLVDQPTKLYNFNKVLLNFCMYEVENKINIKCIGLLLNFAW